MRASNNVTALKYSDGSMVSATAALLVKTFKRSCFRLFQSGPAGKATWCSVRRRLVLPACLPAPALYHSSNYHQSSYSDPPACLSFASRVPLHIVQT